MFSTFVFNSLSYSKSGLHILPVPTEGVLEVGATAVRNLHKFSGCAEWLLLWRGSVFGCAVQSTRRITR